MDIKKVADLARLELTAEEIEEYGSQLEQIIKYVDQLNNIDVDDIVPTAHAAPVFDVYREDEIQEERVLSAEEVLANAPESAKGEIKMPKVIE